MKITFLTLFIFTIIANSIAQTADDVVGKWQSTHGSGRIQIYKRGHHYFGKIIWLKEPNDESGKQKLDINNPSVDLKDKPIIGLEILKDFTYKGHNVWANGKIYDPKSGNTYNCQLSIAEKNKLNIRAYFGLNILGKTETWTRVE